MIGPLSFLDAILLVIALISGILAMYRGLTREVLSILSWAGAAVAAVIFVLYYRDIADDVAISLGLDKKIALGVCALGIFTLVLIVVHFITSKFADSVLESRIGALDRSLGFVFGLLRGFVLVVILYLFGTFLEKDEAKHPYWVTQSQSLSYIKDTGNYIVTVMKKFVPEKIEIPKLNENPEKLNETPEIDKDADKETPPEE